jgi:hypothetical protein
MAKVGVIGGGVVVAGDVCMMLRSFDIKPYKLPKAQTVS